MKSEKLERIYKIIMLIIITALITFIVTSAWITNYMGGLDIKKPITTFSTTQTDLGKQLSYYKDFIKKHYIYEIDEEKMEEGAIKGYFEGLDDEYCEYITKEEMKEYMADTTGKYVGIGVYIANDTSVNKILVIEPMKDSPAEEAGIKPGDYIIKVDGIEYTGEQITEASNKLKAEEGTKAKVTILREEKTIELEVERRTIIMHKIETQILENDVGYISITSFDDGTFKEFKEKYEELKEKNIKSLIIDLRDNGGGIVDEAINIADMFVEKGKTLLITKSKNDSEEITKSKKDKEIDMPIVILVNDKTASASEILTLAIKENNEGTITVGRTTYGKGIIQSIFSLKDGSGIKLTTEEYFSPNHNSIHKVGITPDYDLKNEKAKDGEEVEDLQLEKAIELLK